MEHLLATLLWFGTTQTVAAATTTTTTFRMEHQAADPPNVCT
jgi:hypothetical protein